MGRRIANRTQPCFYQKRQIQTPSFLVSPGQPRLQVLTSHCLSCLESTPRLHQWSRWMRSMRRGRGLQKKGSTIMECVMVSSIMTRSWVIYHSSLLHCPIYAEIVFQSIASTSNHRRVHHPLSLQTASPLHSQRRGAHRARQSQLPSYFLHLPSYHPERRGLNP